MEAQTSFELKYSTAKIARRWDSLFLFTLPKISKVPKEKYKVFLGLLSFDLF
jgi:hypothetical protein